MFVNKNDLTGGWFRLNNDFLGLEDINTTNRIDLFIDGYYVQSYDPLPFIEVLKEAEAKGNGKISADRLRLLRSSIKEDGNNILVFGKLKW